MIRLAWRQFRVQALVTFALLVVIAIVLAVTGPQLVHLYDTTIKPCKSTRRLLRWPPKCS